MGVYLSDVTVEEWNGRLLRLGSALDFALTDRGLPLFMPEPDPTGDDVSFEEKLTPSMDGFAGLCDRELQKDLRESLDWDMIIPVDFDGPMILAVPSTYSDTTTVRSSHRLLEAMQILADKIGLPGSVPAQPADLELSSWFWKAKQSKVPEGRWRDDPDAAFYVAVFLRAAEYSLSHTRAVHVS